MAKKIKRKTSLDRKPASRSGNGRSGPSNATRIYSIPDHRLEKPNFTVRQVRKGDEVRYEVEGNLSAPVPPIRESKYLTKQQHVEIYRWMLLNRKMEQADRKSVV